MSSESSSVSCKRGPIFLDEGRSEMQLLRIRGSYLFLLDPEENILLESGDLVLSLVMQPHSPLAAVMATVGDVQWPLGKDSPAMKLGSKLYSFALPGLIYGLQLRTQEGEEKLETLLQHYSAFQINVDISADLRRATLNVEKGISVEPRMMKHVQHARRVSAIAKLFSKALVRGVINPIIHVKTANASTTSSSPSNSSISEASRLIQPESFMIVNVNAFAQVLEAVETGGKSLLNYTSYVHETQIAGGWTLNKMGLQALFRAITQTVALNLREASYCSFDSGAIASAESTKTLKSTRPTSSMSQYDGSTCSSNVPHPPRLPKPLVQSISKSVSKPPTPNRAQYRPSSTSTHSSSSQHGGCTYVNSK